MQCRTCGDHGNLSLLHPEHASLLPQLAAGCSVCHDCVVEIKNWINFLHRFQTSQTHFQRVLKNNQNSDRLRKTDVPLKLAECRVAVPKLLECDLCCFYTDNKTQLATHMQAHLYTPNTADGTRTGKHAANVGRKLINQKCDECCKTFKNPEVFTWHNDYCHGTDAIVKIVKINNQQHRFHCVLCETRYPSLLHIIRHLRNEHRLKILPLHCSNCDKTFLANYERNMHQQKCKIKFSVSSTTKLRNVKCRMCDTCFESETLMKEHVLSFHAAIKTRRTYQCLHCKKSFNFITHLKSHCNVKHPGKNILQCEVCEAEFASHEGYSEHKKYKHGNHVFTCNVCKKKFKSKGSYMYHRKYMHAAEVFNCTICSATFTMPCNLQRHMKCVHTMDKNPLYSCKLCSATFKWKHYLQVHLRDVHTAPILHCQLCNYSTRRKYSLVVHFRMVHPQVKKEFSCKFCSAKYRCKEYVNMHVRSVHSGRIYNCDQCNYSSCGRNNFFVHFRRRHFKT